MTRAPFLAALVLLLLAWPAASALAQQDILNPEFGSRVFSVQYSGTINAKSAFQHARGQLTISHPTQGDLNPLLVVIDAQPALAGRNTFYFNSNECGMEVTSNTLRCRLQNVGAKKSDLHFYYMSPALYGNKGFLTQHDSERIKWVDTHARPTRIYARDAELTLRVSGNSVSGTVWMTGYDDIGHEPVQYVANFQGYEYVLQQPRQP